MIKQTIKIKGMSCSHCVKSVKQALSKLPVKICSLRIGSTEIEYDNLKISFEKIKEAIENAGYEAEI